METGLYEQLINKVIATNINRLDKNTFYVHKTSLDKQEASRYLSQYVSETIQYALNEIPRTNQLEKQIDVVNKIILLLVDELRDKELSDNLIEAEANILEGVISRLDSPYKDFGARIREIMPYTRLSQSELFTGNQAGISLESEIRKEILSSDEICWLVSFIKFSGIRIFKDELEEFTKRGRLRIITTSYMGATDVKAVEFLSKLPNTEVKVSYNHEHERLHAKAYLFLRNSGFNTGYIGSSNMSRSALTNGLEWNMKITTREIAHIIDKFQKTFETYWNDREFESYRQGDDRPKLQKSLKSQSLKDDDGITTFFEINPKPFQIDILEKLQAERVIHNRSKNLIVAATGTGKTFISAFDFKRFKKENENCRLLFIAHRKEILNQARDSFRHILRDGNFGELWVDGIEPIKFENLFASIQTLKSQIDSIDQLSNNYFDYIIIDEVHHIAANSYRPILERFEAQILLGLTATPERMDGADILEDFGGRIAAEIRLPEALNRKLLSPFQYFSISDSVDLTNVSWNNGRYAIGELTRLYTEDDRRVGEVLANCEKYLTDIKDVRALGFCVSQEHARYMAEKFTLAGLRADYLTSENAKENRNELRQKLMTGKINYLFVVDIFNEGIDIPEIDTALFLRPTESLTVFLQQLGRGLRLAEGKECLTVLDFIGNARPEYDFEHKFRALIGKTHTSILKEIEDDFPHLPLGCTIRLEKKAKEVILANIREATDLRRPKLLQRIQNYQYHSNQKLTLSNFAEFYNIDIRQLYTKGSWKRLCADAGVIPKFTEPHEKELTRFISQRLIATDSISYFRFIQKLIQKKFSLKNLDEEENLMALMLHYDVWQKPGKDLEIPSLEKSLSLLNSNPILVNEIDDLLEVLIDKIEFIEQPIHLGYKMPLRVHSRYTRDQILVAMRLHQFEKASSNREGIAYNEEINTEALFVTLKKSEKEYSPTTMYEDYALNEEIFHWQSQNSTSPKTPKGLSYIQHQKLGKKILLFVREQNKDEYNVTMGYIFLGEANLQKYSGSKPMNIQWILREPMPNFILKESKKLAAS